MNERPEFFTRTNKAQEDTTEPVLRVFVVEDMDALRYLMVKRLNEIGNVHVIGEAWDVASALDGIARVSPDVVILDLRLRDGSGFSVLQEIKCQPVPPRVVVFTSYTEDPFRRKCLELGADSFLDKIQQSEELYRLIERWALSKTRTT